MQEPKFQLDGLFLDQISQPILFAKDGLFVHGNQAALTFMQPNNQAVADCMTDTEFVAYEGLQPGEALAISLDLDGQFYDATVSKNPDYAIFFLSPRPNFDGFQRTIFPSIGSAIRGPSDQIYKAMELLSPMLEDLENETYQTLTAQVNQGMYRLLRLSANIFDYSLFSENKRALSIDKVNIVPFFENKFMELESLTAACGMVLTTDLAAKNLVGYLDEQQIYRMILNLVSNAISASQPGGTIHLQVTAKGQLLQIQVSDKGCGMSPQILSQAFRQFENDAIHQKTSASGGFGLALAREIAIAHGGTLMVNTAPNMGTKVTATAKLGRANLDLCTGKTTLDYTGGLNICVLEMAEILPFEEFDSRSI